MIASDRFLLTPYILDAYLPELEPLANPGWKVNKIELPAGEQQERMAALYQPLSDFSEKTVREGDRPVSIAGDCCATIGMLAGLQRAGLDPWLIWLDAHGDFNTWETTPSGFLGGMPLAMLVGRGEQTMPKALGLNPLPEGKVILSDARGLDPGEREAVDESAVLHLKDIAALLERTPVDRPLYVHFDTDVLRPEDAPAMTYRTPGGPSAGVLKGIFHGLAGTGQVAAVSMTTWNPEFDVDGQSQAVCMELLRVLLG